MKTLILALGLLAALTVTASENCKLVEVNNEFQNICFPAEKVCVDLHGIGDGNPIEIDCWEGGSRFCSKGGTNWPECAGGTVADVCKTVEIDSQEVIACFPEGHVCMDPHGIGDGNPIEIDCWERGTRSCSKGSASWPECAGGELLN